MVSGLGLVTMQMNQNALRATGDADANSDLIDLKTEIPPLLIDGPSCSASLFGTVFRGSSIKDSPVPGLELWTANQAGARSRKILSTRQIYGKLKISSISFSMPDYLLGVDFSAAMPQSSHKGLLTISGEKVNMGKTRAFEPLALSLTVTFTTAPSGLSSIISCTSSGLIAPSASPQGIDWY